MSKEDEIKRLEAECKDLNEKATVAYKNRDLVLEDKYQAQIDQRKERISKLENEMVKDKKIDIEDEIEKRRKTHSWTDSIRCNNCSMKTETFGWQADGARNNLKEGFVSETIKILEGMRCKKK